MSDIKEPSEKLDSIKNDVEEIKRILLKNRKDLEISDIRSLLSKLTNASEDLVKWEEKNKQNIEEVKYAVSDIGRKLGIFSLAAGVIVVLLLVIAIKV
tara:strand:+ start:522 stop:815 length:294 start_codon:yes stop_codon:yes gene_type:complete